MLGLLCASSQDEIELTRQMMVGAIGWGVLSDMLGRSLPFNSTLFLTAVFGIGASFAPNFPVLLGWMFMLGSAVGYVPTLFSV
jgi:MFS family permease